MGNVCAVEREKRWWEMGAAFLSFFFFFPFKTHQEAPNRQTD